jgi:hypothetical protein
VSSIDTPYVAGLLDIASRIAVVSTTAGTQLPDIAVSSPNFPVLNMLAEMSDVRAFITHRTYDRHRCAQHCESAHQHVVSNSGRWNVKGAKATVILAACLPHMRVQREAAEEALAVGLAAPCKPATMRKMGVLGWPLPADLLERH